MWCMCKWHLVMAEWMLEWTPSWYRRSKSSVWKYADRQAKEMDSFTFSWLHGLISKLGKYNGKLPLIGNHSVNTHLLSTWYVSDTILCNYRAWLLFSRTLWSTRGDRVNSLLNIHYSTLRSPGQVEQARKTACWRGAHAAFGARRIRLKVLFCLLLAMRSLVTQSFW